MPRTRHSVAVGSGGGMSEFWPVTRSGRLVRRPCVPGDRPARSSVYGTAYAQVLAKDDACFYSSPNQNMNRLPLSFASATAPARWLAVVLAAAAAAVGVASAAGPDASSVVARIETGSK